MKVAYFSTASAIGSCSSYSRFTISGGLLMMDIGLLLFFLFLVGLTGTRARYTGNSAFPCSLGWSDRHGFRGNEVGSLQPSPVFCPRPKSTVAPGATSALSITSVHRRGERKGERIGEPRVSCAVHPFSDSFVKRASPIPHKIGLKEHCSFRSQLRKLQS